MVRYELFGSFFAAAPSALAAAVTLAAAPF
jgi:hypothetical protein